jgi:putative endonuclease
MTNRPDGVLYVGVTSDLKRRVYEHRNGLLEGFSNRYQLHRLVYFEVAVEMYSAIAREKQLKAGSRRKKVTLIEAKNPEWRDLYEEL